MAINALLRLLHERGYRDTQPRRLVLSALSATTQPLSPYDVHKNIAQKHGSVNIVTVYRILELFQNLGLVHRHPCSGKLSLCTQPGRQGLHGYLHCHDCGTSTEFCSTELSTATAKHAQSHGFSHTVPLLEIVGHCARCAH